MDTPYPKETIPHLPFRPPRRLDALPTSPGTDDTGSVGSLDSNPSPTKRKAKTSASLKNGRGTGARCLSSRVRLICKTDLISIHNELPSLGLLRVETRSESYAAPAVIRKCAKVEFHEFRDPVMNLSYANLQPLNELSCLSRACNLCLSRTLVDHDIVADLYAQKTGGTRFEGSNIDALTSYCSQKRPDVLISNQSGKMNWLVGKRGRKQGGAYLVSVTVDYTEFGSGKGNHFLAAFPGNNVLRDPNFPEVLVMSKASLKALKVVKLNRLWRVRVRR